MANIIIIAPRTLLIQLGPGRVGTPGLEQPPALEPPNSCPDRVVDHLPLHSRILTHPWCDYAGFCCLAAFSAKPENEGRDADSDWSVAMNESHQLRLARRGACKSGPRRNSTTPIRIICPRHHLAEIKFAWMSWNRRIHVSMRTDVIPIVARIHQSIFGDISKLVLVPTNAIY